MLEPPAILPEILSRTAHVSRAHTLQSRGQCRGDTIRVAKNTRLTDQPMNSQSSRGTQPRSFLIRSRLSSCKERHGAGLKASDDSEFDKPKTFQFVCRKRFFRLTGCTNQPTTVELVELVAVQVDAVIVLTPAMLA
jgi:hypothetical protein